MTRLTREEVDAAAIANGYDPAWVLAVDVAPDDVVVVLRIPRAEVEGRFSGGGA